jgi:hypothetical protein
MKKIRLLRSKLVQELNANIIDNLERYRTGNFDYLEADPSSFFEINTELDEHKLALVDCTADDHNEVECCAHIYDAMGSIPPYLARDPRLWVYLTHTSLMAYSRKRWPIPDDDEKAVAHIRKHFFAIGTRGIERDNAVSRLWWMAVLCSRVSGLTMREALTSFLYQYDVRANIIERPTTSQSIPVFSAVIKKLDESYKTDEKTLFEREKFRAVMKELNLQGGVKLLGALDENEIGKIVDRCMS